MDDPIFIWLDDIRTPPDGDEWIRVYNATEAYHLIRQSFGSDRKIAISLDHDLGEAMSTGYDLLNWLERDIVRDENFRPNILFRIHSANPVGRDNMKRAIESIERRLYD